MAGKRQTTTDAVDILHRRYFDGKPDMKQLLEEERLNAEIARQIFDLRTKAGLTQKELADLVGTQPSAVSRLENTEYRGHSLAMLHRIAFALAKRVQIRFVPPRKKASRTVSRKKAASRTSA